GDAGDAPDGHPGLLRLSDLHRAFGRDEQQDQDDAATSLRLPRQGVLQAKDICHPRGQVRFSRMNPNCDYGLPTCILPATPASRQPVSSGKSITTICESKRWVSVAGETAEPSNSAGAEVIYLLFMIGHSPLSMGFMSCKWQELCIAGCNSATSLQRFLLRSFGRCMSAATGAATLLAALQRALYERCDAATVVAAGTFPVSWFPA